MSRKHGEEMIEEFIESEDEDGFDEEVSDDVGISSPAAEDDIDIDTYSDNLSQAQLDRLAGTKRLNSRPDISNLPNGIGRDGMPIFVPGDKIVIERYASFLRGNPYLDTRTYRVQKVDLVTGKLHLWDESLDQYALDNWKHGLKIGQIYKLSLGRLVSSKKKRGRPRKEPVAPPTTPQNTPDDGTIVVKRGRGRPKGVKNRSKDLIRAEKREAADIRAAKKNKH